MFVKISRKIIIVLLIVILGGLGGIIADRYLFPYLSTNKLFSKYAFLKKSTENVTVINRTEQIFVKEDSSVGKIGNQAANTVVNIISLPEVTTTAANRRIATTQNGTGVIVTSDGLIMTYVSALNLTNATYKVLAADGNAYDAALQGVDAYSNLAFLKINASNLPVIAFGNSDEAQPGEKVITVGNEFGSYANRYALGLLSGFNSAYNIAGKAVAFSDKLEGVFEYGTTIENQSVGGPVLDYAGQAIGIMGSVAQNGTENFFVIPANKVRKVIDRAIAKETAKAPALGAYYISLNKTVALAAGLSVEKGALIYSPSGQASLALLAGSPAQKAGLRLNDLIIAVNGRAIDLENTLPDLLYQFKKGDMVELTVVRETQEIKVPVQL